jgi:uracil-DNA glycosylase family 4
MAYDDLKAELRNLVGEVNEQALFALELGIQLIDPMRPVGFSGITEALVPSSVPEPLRFNTEPSAETAFPQATRAIPATEQTKFERGGHSMAPRRSSDKSQVSARLEPQETMFGTVLPTDEGSLPKSGETLEDIWRDIGDCTRCDLCESRTHVVNSEGNRTARLMFVGEAPGADEDAQARPFVGRAGQLLNKIIEAIGLKREEVFIGNVNRCRPPQNRTPTLTEAATCKPFLLREIAVVKPEVIVVLGNTAMKNLLETKEGITRVRGIFQDFNGIKVMPTFHPAYLLRDPSKKRETWEDMKKVRDYLDGKIRA